MALKKTTHYPLILVFLIFSMLLNCMGIMIIQFSEQNISYGGLGLLEAFKDLPIAVSSLVLVNVIARVGAKWSLYFALGFAALCCLVIPFVGEFWFMKIWFALIGVGFAVGKMATFSLLRFNYKSSALASVMNQVEASFMFGIFFVNIGFGWLISSSLSEYWMFGFWGIAALCLLTMYLLRTTGYRQVHEPPTATALTGFLGLLKGPTLVFLLIMMLIVFTEQCLNSWLPAFYRANFSVSSGFALQSSAFLALFSFVGRYLTSKIIHRFHWFTYVRFCMAVVALVLLLMFFSLHYFPNNNSYLVFLIPSIGLFLSPLYPVVNSRMLSGYDEKKVGVLISGLVIFSSLGSSLGSIYISVAFHWNISEFYPLFVLGSLTLLFILTLHFKKNIISN